MNFTDKENKRLNALMSERFKIMTEKQKEMFPTLQKLRDHMRKHRNHGMPFIDVEKIVMNLGAENDR